jgi:hypothetical protein
MNNKIETTMNNKPIAPPQTDNNSQPPTFQWEAPVLYTEEWLKTLGGGITDLIENGQYHT